MKLIFRVVTALVLTVVLLAALVLLLPGEKIARLAADQLETQTGRKLDFGGKVRFTFWPTLGVKADAVTLSNADWAGPEPLLRAERLTIGVSAAELIQGDVRVTEVSAILPHLNLATNAEGVGNWVMGGSGAAAGGSGTASGGALPLRIEAVELTGASLRYAAHGEAPVEMKNIDLSLLWPDPAGTVNAKATLRPAGEPVEVDAEIGTFAAFLAGEVSSVGATITAPGGKGRFDGHAGINGEASGRLTFGAEDALKTGVALGVFLPDALAQKAVFGADVTYTADGRLSMRDLALELGANRLTGAADVEFRDRPNITAQLRGGALDFTAFAGSAGGAGSGTSGSSGWPEDVIDASALGLADAVVDLTFDSLRTGGVNLGASKLNLTVERSRAVLKFLPAAMFGGQVQGQLVANNRNGLSVAGKMTFTGIRLERALGETAGYDRLNGEALGELEFLGSGNSVAAIMRSLSGKGWLEAGKGFFTGFDLEQLMRSGGNGGSTVFDQLTASYTIEGGNLRNEDLLVLLKGFRAEGKGRIGLGARDIDYLFTPQLVRAGRDQVLTIPVRIRGSWDNPDIRPDFSQALQPKIEEIEQEAKDRVRQKLAEELDLETEIAPEQDLNDVLKQRIEQEARDQLLRLLGGD
ncbi:MULTISPECIES: AsmA family protein [unclassified Leisingera]|uniref:AsmA family protein n=1 Tax=unclassified Leisingera TaxID=2614906 RepID=UPI00058095E1|nr:MULTISPECIES: AsmA family protein [unclassified Leisingera]KIC15113.1 cell envelope biogenesis protein AsmA [Leisingera sp. ANG-DT]KIC34277.1 cell envelope biogenesis protein AsmA [Leisingera sp. ANG-S5]